MFSTGEAAGALWRTGIATTAIGGETGAARRLMMAKGQVRSNKEARKPKKEKTKNIAANPSQKGGQRGLENLKNS